MSGVKDKTQPFLTSLGHGGLGMNPQKTAVVFIELQNEFATKGGKLHEAVREVMEKTNMLENCIKMFQEIRKSDNGVKIFHAPISFAEGGSDNPNRYLGILGGCDYDDLFLRGSWNAQIIDDLQNVNCTKTTVDECKDNDIVVVKGKRGLSAFVNTDFEDTLKKYEIETIALAGFMANCCVESTMRDAYDRGYNVITLVDCVATTTVRGYQSCVDITYPFFSTPMNCNTFLSNVKESSKISNQIDSPIHQSMISSSVGAMCNDTLVDGGDHDADTLSEPKFKTLPWAFRAIDSDANSFPRNLPKIYQVGPWSVDVRNSAVGEKIVLRSGEHELRRYLAFAEATGYFRNNDTNLLSDCIYARKLNNILDVSKQNASVSSDVLTNLSSNEGFGWLCHMVVVRLPVKDASVAALAASSNEGGCLIYSPVLGPDNDIESVHALLAENDLLPVRIVIAPTPQHHLAIVEYQNKYPSAFFLCGKASGQMNPLTKRRRDLRFDGVLRNERSFGKIQPSNISHQDKKLLPCAKDIRSEDNNDNLTESETVILEPPQLIGGSSQMNSRFSNDKCENNYYEDSKEIWRNLMEDGIFEVCVIDDNRTGEVVLLHKPSKTLIISDLLYKSKDTISGPGGCKHNYSWPEWFADGQEELFYRKYIQADNVPKCEKLLLPHYRTHPSVRTIDIAGTRKAIEKILSWDFNLALACHTDPIDGKEARKLITKAWSWVWN